EKNSASSSVALPVDTLVVPRGFNLIPTSEAPPKLVDYTIANLMTFATPWPIEKISAEASVVTAAESSTAEPSASLAPATIKKPKAKTGPRPKTTTRKPQQKSSSATADWWRGLFWLRIR